MNMTLTEYDKSRLKAKYEHYCNTHQIDSDLFDFKAELDGSLSYWEAWHNIAEKLENFKAPITSLPQNALKSACQIDSSHFDRGVATTLHTPPQKAFNCSTLSLDLDSTDSVAILGDRDTGKTNLIFYLLNNYRGLKDVCLFGYPKSYVGFKSLSTWTDIFKVTDSIIVIDEIHKYCKLYDRRANNELMELLSFLKHQNNTLIFTTQLSQFITKGVEASIQTWLIKRLDIGSLKNGCKAKRILKDTADARITDKGIAINVNEVICFDDTMQVGFNGVHTFMDQGIGKDWKRRATETTTKTTTEITTNTTTKYKYVKGDIDEVGDDGE